ncbi:EAL domain-containing protein [Lactococcus lactis]|uniref:EAL domain-containing protein n=1 Tax=Lactococcus lactis TaxID=1358 RepID=UPI0033969726
MSKKYNNFCFFKQKIVKKKGTQMLDQQEEFELLLRDKKEDYHIFPGDQLYEAIVNQVEHIKYIHKLEGLLDEILAETHVTYSLNVDPQELYYDETFELFKHLKKYNKNLKIELTEHLPYKRDGDYVTEFPLEQVIKLFELGYEIVLDDFLSGINGIDKLVILSPFISRIKISKLTFNKKISDVMFSSFVNEISKLVQEVNPNLSFVIEAEEKKEIIENLSDDWFYQTYFFDKPSILR